MLKNEVVRLLRQSFVEYGKRSGRPVRVESQLGKDFHIIQGLPVAVDEFVVLVHLFDVLPGKNDSRQLCSIYLNSSL